MKRLLITTGIYPPDIGGPATYAKMLVDELPKRGLDVVVLNFSKLQHYPRIVRHIIFLIQILRSYRTGDQIFALDPVSVGFPTAIASKLLRRPFSLRVGGAYAWEQAIERFGVEDSLDDFIDRRYGWRVELLRWIERKVVQSASKIIVPSQYMKRITSQWGASPNNIKVIYNAFEPPEANLSREEIRQVLNIQGQLIVSIGRLIKLKGFNKLIDAIERLRSSWKDLQLVIIGDGPLRDELDQKVLQMGLSNNITMIGRCSHDETLAYLRAADLFILNSAVEGFSHTILEAMGVGTPVIASDVGGNPELINHQTNGLLIPYNSEDEIVQAVSSTLQEPETMRNMAIHGRLTVNKFDKISMVEKTEQFILSNQ